MLQCGQHLQQHVAVTSVRNLRTDIKDGVKGDKALLEVKYSEEVDLPTTFFVKCPGSNKFSTVVLISICGLVPRFNLQTIGAMRLLVATSEVCLCEAPR